MGSTALLKLQEAIYTTLKNDSTLASLVTDVLDYVPENHPPPYIVIGHFTENAENTFTQDGRDIIGRIHIWDSAKESGNQGNEQLFTILDRVVALLDHTDIPVTGYMTVVSEYMNAVTIREDTRMDFDDGVRQVAALFHFFLQKV